MESKDECIKNARIEDACIEYVTALLLQHDRSTVRAERLRTMNMLLNVFINNAKACPRLRMYYGYDILQKLKAMESRGDLPAPYYTGYIGREDPSRETFTLRLKFLNML